VTPTFDIKAGRCQSWCHFRKYFPSGFKGPNLRRNLMGVWPELYQM